MTEIQSPEIESLPIPRYVYDKLEPKCQIRLLELTSPAGASRIEGTLHTLSTSPPHLPRYTAISYAWGDAVVSESLWLNRNQIVPLTSAAAHILRYASRELPIWIDSICINQEDDEEKAWMIPYMARIYRDAKDVCVWLGEWSERINLAFLLIRDIAHGHVINKEILMAVGTLGRDGKAKSDFEAQWSEERQGSVQAWGGLAELLNRPWFTRAWIIQEIALGQEVTVTCGNGMIKWDEMDAAADSILNSQSMQERLLSATPESDVATVLPAALGTISDLSCIARNAKTRHWRTLQQNLLGFADSKATNSVDRVLSLIQVSYASLRVNDVPGSDMSVSDAYTQLTSIAMRRDQELLAMHAAGIGWPGQMEQLPSWVPDYTMNHRRYRSWSFVMSDMPAKVALNPPHPPLKGGVWATVVQGSVEERGELIRWFNRLDSLFFKPRQPLSQPYRNACKKFTESTALEAIISSLVGGKELWDSVRFKGYDNSRFLSMSSSFPYVDPVWAHECFMALLLRLSLNPALSNVWESFSTPESARAAEMFCNTLDDFSDWSMFETREGLLGRGPPGARAGDVVCVFQGARTPMLLRRPCSRGFDEERGGAVTRLAEAVYKLGLTPVSRQRQATAGTRPRRGNSRRQLRSWHASEIAR
ncbi:hypothetical protein B7463_g6715, partial [Scytalidium lignicola]